MYENSFYSVTSHALRPLPLSQTVSPSRTPSSVTYFMDGLQLKLHKPTMANGYSLRMCARHVESRSK